MPAGLACAHRDVSLLYRSLFLFILIDRERERQRYYVGKPTPNSVSEQKCLMKRMLQVDREIPLDEYTEEGHQFYLSLMRGDLQVRQGDTVYVLRDIPIDDKRPDVSQKNGDKVDSPKTKRVDRKKLKIAKGSKSEENVQNKVRLETFYKLLFHLQCMFYGWYPATNPQPIEHVYTLV